MLEHELVVGVLSLPQGVRLLAGAVIAVLPRRLLLLVALVCLLLLTAHLLILLHQPVPLALVPLTGVLLQLRHQLRQIPHVAVIRLLGRRLGIAGSVAAGERRRLPHGVRHSLPPLLGVEIGVVFCLRIRLRVVGKWLAAGDLVVQLRQLPLKRRPILLRLQRLHALLCLPRRRQLVRGREPLLQPFQGVVGLVRHAPHDLLAGGGVICRCGTVETPPGLIPHHAVHGQFVLALVVQHRIIGVAAEHAVLGQLVAVCIELLLQVAHGIAPAAPPKFCCHIFPPYAVRFQV